MDPLPVGQTPAALRRFGLPRFAAVWPAIPTRPVVWVFGTVRRPIQIELSELLQLPDRRTRPSDLHCVTTWSATDLHWGGVPFRAVHERLADLVRVHRSCTWITFSGLDGYRSCLRLTDALAENVLLANTLHGAPLTANQGAPARLIAPDHYGFKSVRHVCAIEYRTGYDPGSAGWLAHRRGRVAHEERSPVLPGWLWRGVWSRLVPRLRRRYERFERP